VKCDAAYPAIVLNAVGRTLGVLGVLLLAYRSGLVRPSENFKLGIVAATGGLAVLYLVPIWLCLEILRLLAKLQGKGRR
jgi:uncharacterized YccA/Bax inhibitor family protein